MRLPSPICAVGHGSSVNGVADFVGQRQGSGPLAAQYGDKLARTVDGIFASGLAGIFGATEQRAKSSEGADDIGLDAWEVVRLGIQQIFLFLWAACDGFIRRPPDFCCPGKGVALPGQDEEDTVIIWNF